MIGGGKCGWAESRSFCSLSRASTHPRSADDLPVKPVETLASPLRSFVENHCVGCHDGASKKGGLDLESLAFEPGDARNFAALVKVLDRVNAGEMPPKKSPRPESKEVDSFSRSLASMLSVSEKERVAREGRAVRR